jgi:adenine phosphoribosyltransferase
MASRDVQRGSGMSADAPLSDRLRALIHEVPDFPRAGIVFRDITALLRDGDAFREAVEALSAAHRNDNVGVVAGIESRGFIIGAAVAHHLGVGFIPIRKRGRLPRKTVSVTYALEYGEAELEIHADAISAGDRVLVVDDLLATGGTAEAAIRLIEGLGGAIVGIAFLVELVALGGARLLGRHRHVALVKV